MHLTCEHVSKMYRTHRRGVLALDDVTLQVKAGEFVCIIGSSGCGKTTLLKLIAGLLAPTSGRIAFDRPAADGRPQSALVFQEHGLLPWLTVIDNVAFGLRIQGVARAERRERAAVLLGKVGLGAFLDSFPHEVSAGMRQRVNIARAFLADPHVLLMDEPFASLDALTKLVLQQELVRMWEARRSSVIYVTHDLEEAVLLGDRVIVMMGGAGHGGRIREDIAVPLARPRDLVSREPAEIKDLTWHIWKMLEDDVRRRLSIPT
jgi:NitT/TauT family transport system ATP-binding protein